MGKKDKKREKRKKLLRERQEWQKGRTAVVHDGDKTTVITQRTNKGYDVQMIRDFLDHLLLEVRVQQFENLRSLKKLKATGDLDAARKAADETVPALVEQFAKYQRRYQTALIPATAIDGAGASEEEIRAFTTVALQKNIERRDEQIRHLEALQELFDEALLCAKVPYGFDKDGKPIQPVREFKVREVVDSITSDNLPDYDELLPSFIGHPVASEEGIAALKNAPVIVATSDRFERPLVLYGAAEVQRSRDAGETGIQGLSLEVDSPEELQFLLAAIRRFRGKVDYLRDPWEAFSADSGPTQS